METSAQAIYPRLIQAGLKVATCEAIVDGYRSTVMVELEKDDSGVRAALKKLIEGTPIVSSNRSSVQRRRALTLVSSVASFRFVFKLKNKIEITGNLDTVSDIFVRTSCFFSLRSRWS